MATPARKRPRLRTNGLKVEPHARELDLRNVAPLLPLKSAGRKHWDLIASDPPFWLTEADVPTIGVWCAATDMVKAATGTIKMGGHDVPAAPFSQQAAAIKEWRALADQLGMTPTARSRLRLTEAHAAAAARKVTDPNAPRTPAPIDLDDLLADDD